MPSRECWRINPVHVRNDLEVISSQVFEEDRMMTFKLVMCP
jgi:hypothetical protein